MEAQGQVQFFCFDIQIDIAIECMQDFERTTLELSRFKQDFNLLGSRFEQHMWKVKDEGP